MDSDRRRLAAEKCLEINREIVQKIFEAERIMQERLFATRKSINDIKDRISSPRDEYNCGFDLKFVAVPDWYEPAGCPPNADTLALRLKTGDLSTSDHWDRSNCTVQNSWTESQSRSLCSIIHQMEVQDRIRVHSEKKRRLAELARSKVDSKEMLTLETETAMFDLKTLKEKTLEELVSTGKGTYDWERVSTLLRRVHTASECRGKWVNYLHPSFNTVKWNEEEDYRLAQIAQERGEQDWESIAAELGTGRSAYACFVAFRSRLRGTMAEFLPQHYGWTAEQDLVLTRAVKNWVGPNGVRWDRVAQRFPDKTQRQVFTHWTYTLNPSVSRGPLSPYEELMVVRCIGRFGMDFWKIQRCALPRRMPVQLRYLVRYRLAKCKPRGRMPKFNLRVLKALVKFLGPDRWPEVCGYFPKFTAAQLKRRFARLSKREKTGGPAQKEQLAISQPAEETTETTQSDLQTSQVVQESLSTLQPAVGAMDTNLSADLCLVKDELSMAVDENCQRGKCTANQMDGGAVPAEGERKPRRGRPPSRKKVKERVNPKRKYVQSGRYKVMPDCSQEARRELRQKTRL